MSSMKGVQFPTNDKRYTALILRGAALFAVVATRANKLWITQWRFLFEIRSRKHSLSTEWTPIIHPSIWQAKSRLAVLARFSALPSVTVGRALSALHKSVRGRLGKQYTVLQKHTPSPVARWKEAPHWTCPIWLRLVRFGLDSWWGLWSRPGTWEPWRCVELKHAFITGC